MEPASSVGHYVRASLPVLAFLFIWSSCGFLLGLYQHQLSELWRPAEQHGSSAVHLPNANRTSAASAGTIFLQTLVHTRQTLELHSSSAQPSAITSFSAELQSLLAPAGGSWRVVWDDVFDFGGGAASTSARLPLGQSANERVKEEDSEPRVINGTAAHTLQMEQIMACWNAPYQRINQTWDSAMADELAQLKVFGLLWSRPRQRTEASLALVTSANLLRLDQLRAQCKAWPGVLSVAIHVPLMQDDSANLTSHSKAELRAALLQVAALLSDMQHTPSACELRATLAYEVYVELKASILFPVNMLRNLARLQTETPLIALMDVDLLPSKSMYARMTDPHEAESLLKQSASTVFITPGFEVQSRFEHAPWADALVTSGKDVIRTAHREGIVVAFHVERFPKGHAPTDYKRWMTAEDDYVVQYKEGYEPWLTGARLNMPWHDERYRGFGKNKIQQVMNMRVLNYTFKVMHDVWAVHRPHELGSAALNFMTKADKKGSKKNELKEHMFELFEWQVKAGPSFRPVGGAATHNCKSTLPWWQGAGSASAMEDGTFSRAANQQRRAAAAAQQLLQERLGGGASPAQQPAEAFRAEAKQVVTIAHRKMHMVRGALP